jgi:hypothetical protein
MKRLKKSHLATALAATLLIGVLSCTTAWSRDNQPPITVDGLHLVPDTRLGLVYMDPEADLSIFSRLLLMDAQVAFKKNWRRDINQEKPFHVTASDMERIKTEVSALFREIFAAELKSAGFTLVTEQAQDTLIIRPAIVDLNINSPDTPRGGTIRNITESAGDMTLYLELRDSITGDLLAKAMDFQFDRSNITPFMMDRTRNSNAANRILADWARVLVEGLKETGVKTSAQP